MAPPEFLRTLLKSGSVVKFRNSVVLNAVNMLTGRINEVIPFGLLASKTIQNMSNMQGFF